MAAYPQPAHERYTDVFDRKISIPLEGLRVKESINDVFGSVNKIINHGRAGSKYENDDLFVYQQEQLALATHNHSREDSGFTVPVQSEGEARERLKSRNTNPNPFLSKTP
jgi:hypothetical protein